MTSVRAATMFRNEHERGVEFCLVELDDGTHCPCVAFDGGVE